MVLKDHVIVDGKLLLTNKRFSQLKQTQKEQIAQWLYGEYKRVYAAEGRSPSGEEDSQIILSVMALISAKGIWIPESEIIAYYQSKKNHLRKRLQKELDKLESSQGGL